MCCLKIFFYLFKGHRMHFFRIKSGTGDEWLSRTVISSKREIFVICGEGLTLFSHVPSTSPLSASVFPAACALSAPMGHLPLEGKADDTRETYLRRPSGIASYILAAKPPPPFLISHFSFLISHFSFLISHSSEASIPNEGTARPMG